MTPIDVLKSSENTIKNGIGYTVTWTVVVDGVLAYVVYRSEDIGDIHAERVFGNLVKYSLQGTTQGRYLTGGVPPVRFSM